MPWVTTSRCRTSPHGRELRASRAARTEQVAGPWHGRRDRRARLDEALWSRQRSRDLGIIDDPDQRFSFVVRDYAIRGLYAEISNIAQLRDELAGGTARDPVKRVRRPEGQIRRRAPRA
jgi:hypothetical protein